MGNLKNLPEEIARSRRFFLVAENKRPLQKNWSNPAVQKTLDEIDGLAGFDTCGHGLGVDYLFLDFDHVLNSAGDFVNNNAADFVYSLQLDFPNIYIEKSISGTGLHAFLVPSADKFAAISNGKLGVMHFAESKEKNAPKLEVFYGSGGRYCLLTGNLYAEGAIIPSGVKVDVFFESLLEEIRKQFSPPAGINKVTESYSVTPEYTQALILAMLEVINPAALEDSDWLAVMTACKNLDIDYSIVDSWNQRDGSRYNSAENKNRWDSLNDSSYGIETLIGKAQHFGFSVKDFYRQWHNTNYSRDFDAPIKPKLPEGFNIRAGNLFYNTKLVSYTPPLVTKEFHQSDKVFYEVAFLVDGKWKKITVPGVALFDRAKLVALSEFGLGVNTENSKRMCLYFAHLIGINRQVIPVENLYSQGGWTDDSCSDFVYPNDAKVLGNNFDYASAFKVQGDEQKFKRLLLEALSESYVATLVIGVALAAPLIKPLSISNKQLHLGCRSGNGKTALVKLALAIFGNPKFLMSKFNATNNALENFSVALNDFPSAIDELQSISKFQRACVDELLYNFENGRTRARLTRQGVFQPVKYFSGCRITTGEQALTTEYSNEGAKKRCVEIADNKILREELAIEIHRLVGRNYGFYGRRWCDFIKRHLEKLATDYDACFTELCNQNRRAFPEHLSLIAVAQVALKNFCSLVFDRQESILATIHREKVLEQLPLRQEMQNGKRAILTVAEMCARYSKFFLHLEVEDEQPRAADDHTPFDKYGYVLANGDTLIFAQVLRDWLKDFPDFQAIIRDFSELGYLAEFKSKNRPHQKSIRVMGKTIWGYVFRAEQLGNEGTCERKPHEEIEDTEYTPDMDDGYSFDDD